MVCIDILSYQELVCIDILININVFAAQTRGPSQQLSQEDGECEVIVVRENN